MDLQSTIREVQDTLIVMGHIQAKQAQVQRLQAESIEAHERRFERIESNLDATGVRLHEMTDKLDALIRIVDGWVQPPR